MKRNQPRKPRSTEVLTALLHCKGGPHRDKRDRRQGNPRRNWKGDQG